MKSLRKMKLFYNTTKTGAFPIILLVLKMRTEKKPGKADTKILFYYLLSLTVP